MAKGSISVDSENLFPIIKKWLYSDKDIFLRELVSNACDAVTKLKKLAGIGEAEIDGDVPFKITVRVDKKNKQLIVSDNGIGMTEEEIDKYINQIAFSGASDFLAKYKEEENEGAQIIGHFGLGFYSAFMVSDSVEIDSLSYKEGSVPAKWVCDGTMEFDMSEGERAERGTTITLNIAEDSEEFLDEFKIREILHKYCAFLPTEIYLENAEDDEKEDSGDKKDGEKDEPKPINNTQPLWMKKPSECTDEEYKEFYRNVFMDFNEPLFWIHLNVDFPFNLKGILYFPKINMEFAGQEGQIKLYNNQVFVADNVKEVIPEFLMLLKGVIDCPDLPLNVSRSFLQNDGYVKKISAHITKKVADKLTGIFSSDRQSYEKYWDDINIFIKYGCIRDEKFYEKIKDVIIFKTTGGKYVTLDEYLEGKDKKEVYYVSDAKLQSQYIKLFEEQGLEAVELPTIMDTHFISFMEMKNAEVKFKRIDSVLSETAEENAGDEEKNKALVEKFKNRINDESLKIEAQALKNADIPAVMLLGEESRRMQEMYRSYGQQMAGMADMFKDEFTLVINTNNDLIQKLDTLPEEDAELVMDQVYDLAKISHSPLPADEMTKFIERSNMLLKKAIV
ncbi:MAG TPA: molecular chaperone HtpG [Candidatus Ornithomonoglobus intestinigallinarum]|uniref:Molecular chaperone HtpG n=1 Tax=Candidatus Ornithomonoglobus intestinigallinarum TaxID=2840894 RepID=A0A9D1H1X8_9FIRM|nr:molecular chaperone HtpG [Candidatus Ornithomonoglobus intestinigallinarum]